MQLKITSISMRLTTDEDDIKAYASVALNNTVKINGIRIVHDIVGKPVIVYPSKEEMQIIVPLSVEFRQHLEYSLIEHYYSLKKTILESKIRKANSAENVNDVQKGNE